MTRGQANILLLCGVVVMLVLAWPAFAEDPGRNEGQGSQFIAGGAQSGSGDGEQQTTDVFLLKFAAPADRVGRCPKANLAGNCLIL